VKIREIRGVLVFALRFFRKEAGATLRETGAVVIIDFVPRASGNAAILFGCEFPPPSA